MEHFRSKPDLSVVTPCYNEADGVLAFYEMLRSTLERQGCSHEIIFVDDGSTDDTLPILNRIADANERVVVLSLTRNFGHQAALTAGMDHARGRMILVMDSDLQHPPELIPQMIRELATGADVVYAVRQETAGSGLFKRITSNGFYALMNRFGAAPFIPGAADFRLLSERANESIRQMRETHRFLRGLVTWTGYPAKVISYRANPRGAGKSKYTWSKMIRLAFDATFSFSVLPLRFVTGLGLALIGLGLAYLVYILVGVIAWPESVQPGWPSVIASLLVLSGVQLLSLGVIATYVGMIFEQVKGRPLYVLKQGRPTNED
ncbi:MAG: glycosyltransferase family 2 protein [Chloroflexi bacterium]|nr:glycosyltransferase family 2 protein [Chloroflexota bacterium]